MVKTSCVVLVAMTVLSAGAVKAEQLQVPANQPQDEIASLQKEVQNPVANLISLPFNAQIQAFSNIIRPEYGSTGSCDSRYSCFSPSDNTNK